MDTVFASRVKNTHPTTTNVLYSHTSFLIEIAYENASQDEDVVLRHTLPVFTRLGRCPIVSWDFAGAVSIFGPDALPVVQQ